MSISVGPLKVKLTQNVRLFNEFHHHNKLTLGMLRMDQEAMRALFQPTIRAVIEVIL